MEAGRQVEVAKRILTAKNVPYFVAAPLLIQDIHSWTRQGIGGCKVSFYMQLPELDGAIDPVPLGGLVGEDIYLVPERVKRLTGRIKHWIALRKTPLANKKIAIILYGFPPGYGATGNSSVIKCTAIASQISTPSKTKAITSGEFTRRWRRLIGRVKEADEATPRTASCGAGVSPAFGRGRARCPPTRTVNAKTLENG
jgi:magnesium chelatase subunit H